MVLNEKNICHYLINEGFIQIKDVVEGRFSSELIPSRNRNFKVISGNNKLLAKQLRAYQDEKVESIRMEANAYMLMKSLPNWASLQAYIPSFYNFDSVNHILILEYVEGYTNLDIYHYSNRNFPEIIGRKVGSILASLHGAFIKEQADNNIKTTFRNRLPWIFYINKADPNNYNIQGKADGLLMQLIQSNKEFVALIESIKPLWKQNALIHGDIKWMNFLINNDFIGENADVKLIDWEMADYGDFCWDVAGLIQTYLANWGFTQKKQNAVPLDIQNIKGLLQAFWQMYVQQMKFSQIEADAMLLKAMRFTGMRMIQTCKEAASNLNELPEYNARVLQLSFNLLKEPEFYTQYFFK